MERDGRKGERVFVILAKILVRSLTVLGRVYGEGPGPFACP